jgi:ParB-like chromosome segregation protein Spo0J
MPKLEIRTVPLNQLQAAPYNPRKLLSDTDPAYRKLKQSLVEFGLVEPLIWNEVSGHVVGGHLRLRIMQELGYSEVPISVVRLSTEREKALNILLNNQEAQGRYDREKLADLLDELRELPELALTGFDDATLRLLRFEPISQPIEEPATRLEVSLIMEPTTFHDLEADLNALIRQHNLEVHVRSAKSR